MKNKMLLLGLTLAFSFALQAQTVDPAPSPEPQLRVEPEMRARPDADRRADAKAQREEMITKLNLSEDQIAQFDAINKNYRAQTRELRQNNSTDRRAIGQQMRALRDAQQEEIKAILTPEQVTIFEAEVAARKADRRSQHPRTKE
ncbi:MAG: hypothetical protein AAFN81_04670 [Bacteroidota bacterium]